jgi:hypothetical protein
VFEFRAAAGRTYSVLVSDDPVGGSWSVYRQVPAEAAARMVEVMSPLGVSGSAQYFRVVTPQVP